MMNPNARLHLDPFKSEAVLPAKQEICIAGRSRWYALTVRPTREQDAEQWLAARGVYAFHPVRSHHVLRFGRKVPRTSRLLPGYVFARFNGLPIQHRIANTPFITGAVSRADGTWGELLPADLRSLHALRYVDPSQQAALKGDQVQRRRGKVAAGDRALFRVTELVSVECDIVELRGSDLAVVRLRMLGKQSDHVVSIDAVERLPLDLHQTSLHSA